ELNPARRAARRLLCAGAPLMEELESRRLLSGVIAPEINVGFLEGSRAYYGFVNATTRPIDYHSVTLEAPGTLTAWLVGMSSNADLFLVYDTNHNGRIDSGEVLATSTHPGTQSDLIFKSLAAGTYHIGVASRGGTTGYTLALIADYA